MSQPAAGGDPGSGGDTRAGGHGTDLRLLRWTMTTGSSGTARAAVVLAAGDHQWEATAESAGAIGSLYDAVDAALEEVLGGGCGWSRSTSRDRRDCRCDALVELAVQPPATATGERAAGRYAATPAT
jgi:hypothetical protein